MKLREGSVQAAILAYLALRGDCFFWRANTGAARLGGQFVRFGPKGQSDIICCCASLGGRMVAIETKRPDGGRESEDQRIFRESVIAAGGVGIVARSVDEVEAALGPVTRKINLPARRRVYRQ